MSLKTFHIVFIVISSLMSFGVGAWGMLQDNHGDYTVMVVISVVMGIALIIYGIKFLRKLSHESFL